MVTTQELEQQEKQLNTIINEPQPLRRFGSGVDVRKQISIQSGRKESAKKQLEQVQQVKSIVEAQQQTISKEQALERIATISKRKASGLDASVYKRQIKRIALEAGFSGREARRFVKEYEQGREAVKSQESFNKTLTELNKQGLKPVYQDNKLVGFKDEVRGQTISVDRLPKDTAERLDRVGLIERGDSNQIIPTPTEQILNQSLNTNLRNKNIIEVNAVKSVNEQEKVPRNKFLSVRNAIERIELERRGSSNIIKFRAGIASNIAGSVQTFNLVTSQPITQTYTQIKKSIKEFSISKTIAGIKAEPYFKLGELTGGFVTFKGTARITPNILPIAKASITRILPDYRAVKKIELDNIGRQELVIKDVPKVGDIGLIPEQKPYIKNIDIPKTELPATVRGGFGYSTKEQAEFIGTVGATTSQRGLKGLFDKEIVIKEVEEGYGLFATPNDIRTGRSQTRISRLGASPEPASIKDIITFNFQLKQPKSQIFIFPKEKIGRAKGFQPFGKIKSQEPFIPTSELEVVTRPPTLGGAVKITDIKKLGTTVVGGVLGKRVVIYEAKLDNFNLDLKDDLNKFNKVKTVSGESSNLINKPILPTTAIISRVVSEYNDESYKISYKKSSSINTSYKENKKVDYPKIKTLSYSKTKSPSYPTPKYPSTPVPNYTSYKNISYATPNYPNTPTPNYPNLNTLPYNPPISYKKIKLATDTYKSKSFRESGNIIVEVRRQGEFRTVGTGLTLGQAKSLGINITNRSLARSVRFKGAGSQKINLPSIRYKAPARTSKLNIPSIKTFVERSKYALSTRTELAEIGAYRR